VEIHLHVDWSLLLLVSDPSFTWAEFRLLRAQSNPNPTSHRH